MNENIDLTKILDGCPKRTEFYHAGFGRVWLVDIDLRTDHPIRLSTADDYIADVSVTEKGTLSMHYKGECLLFPSKDQRDWSKFVRFWDKPKIEKFNPHTLQPYDKVLARDSYYDYWVCTLFSHIRSNAPYPIYCTGNPFSVCIPYNEETKHLVGTDEDCPEYYKWWEK